MVDIDFISQLVGSMENAVNQLDLAISKNDKDQANKLRTFIFDLHQQIDKAIRGA